MDWKEKVTNVTDKVFPGLSHNLHHKIIENEVMSNLPLQMSLYFNVIFAPLWLLIIGLLLYDKYHCYSEFTKFVIVTIIIAVIITEIIRLYLGYEGNLRDKIPELAGFWMLSILLQFPLQGFLLLNPYFELRVIEKVVQSVMYILLSFQLLSGYSSLKYTAKQQATYFRIMKLTSDISVHNKYKFN